MRSSALVHSACHLVSCSITTAEYVRAYTILVAMLYQSTMDRGGVQKLTDTMVRLYATWLVQLLYRSCKYSTEPCSEKLYNASYTVQYRSRQTPYCYMLCRSSQEVEVLEVL